MDVPPANDDLGWETAVDRITDLLLAGTPFCHVRFADGELDSASHYYRSCADGWRHTEVLTREMQRVLRGIKKYEDVLDRLSCTSQLMVGGTCIANRRHRVYLESLGYRFSQHPNRPDGWVPCHVIGAGIETLRSLPMVELLRQLGEKGRLWLVGPGRIRGACRSKHIEVHQTNALADVKRVTDTVTALPKEAGDDNAVVLYCCGPAAKVMIWDSFSSRPDLTYLDMGHFFDRAYGIHNRTWHVQECQRRVVYDEFFTPLIKGRPT